MSDPLDDFNRRMTADNGSWMQGTPTNAAESAAQSFIDTQRRSTGAIGGGSIDFGVRISSIILLVGIVLFSIGTYITDNFHAAMAMTGLLIVIISGFLLLVGVGGLAIGCIKGLGSAGGWRSLLLALIAALAGWWLSPWLWMMSSALVPKGLIPLAAAALVFAITGRR